MNKMLKKTLALFLGIWMLCLTGIVALAGSEDPLVIPTGVKMNRTSLSMTYGGTAQLNASVEPSGADQIIAWSSSNPALVSVDSYGNLTAAKDTADTPSGKQTVTITAACASYPSIRATCTVTVDNDLATKLNSFLKLIKSLLTSLTGVFSDPAKQFGTTLLDFIKQLLGMLPKSE